MTAQGLGALEAWSARLADGEKIDWTAARGDLSPEEFARLRRLADLAGAMRRAGGAESARIEPDGRWGHLEIRNTLGRGSYGQVMLAFDPILQREVALKLRRADAPATDPEAWIEEARQLARVRHPNVLAVHGADIQGGVPGLWADRVQGSTLRDHVREHRLSSCEAMRIARQLAAAVAAVHAHGLVHGDLKPANVMIEPDGRVVLMDFGTARREGGRGRDAGSPAVMSPERLDGGPPSRADDIHALGAVFAFLTSGEYPFPADSLDDLRELHRQRARPRVDRPGTSTGWRRLLRSMLAVDATHRPAIDRVVEHLERLRTAPARRRRTLAIGTIVVLLIAGLAVALTAYLRVRDAESETSAVNDLLRDVLAAPRATEMGREARVADVLEQAVPEAERRFVDRPLALARVRALVGRSYESLGLPEAAEPLLRDALAVYVEALGTRNPRSVAMLDAIARIEDQTDRDAAAEETWNLLLERVDPSTASGRNEAIYARIGLAGLRLAENRIDEALGQLELALAMHRGAETDRAAQSAVAMQALVLLRAGRLDEAAAAGTAALDEGLRINGRYHVNTLIARDRLIQVRLGRGEMDAAEALARDNLADTLEWLGEGERRTVTAQMTLSNVLADRGRLEQSIELLEAAASGARDAFGMGALDALVIEGQRAGRLAELGRFEQAAALAEEVAAGYDALATPAGPVPWINALNLAEMRYWLGDFEAARERAAAVHAQVVDAHGADHPLARIADSYRAAALTGLGRAAEAEALLGPAYEALTAVFGADHPQVLMTAGWLAESRVVGGATTDAMAELETVLERARAALEPGHYRLRDLGRIADRVRQAVPP